MDSIELIVLTQASHPKTLPLFFGTEMWERYGFYIVQSLLALYLAIHYGWDDAHIYTLVGSFTAITYLSPVIGGWIADKFLGQKTTIILGAILLFLNYLSLTLLNNTQHKLTFALAGIAVGTGLLKPNISSLLGNQYPQNSPLRENGFTIFYMGITTGIILGTTLPSQLYHHFGWSFAFASAALGMVLSLLIFIYGILRHSIRNYHPHTVTAAKALFAILIISLMWFMAFYILIYPKLANLAFSFVVLLSVAYILYSAKQENSKQAKNTLIIGMLCSISTLFWAFYFQMFTSLTFFIHRLVEPTLLNFRFPAPYYVSIESFGMLIFGFFIAKQTKKNQENKQARIAFKFLAAVLFMLLAYALIALITKITNPGDLISPLWIILAYLMISIAELLLSPVGLFAVTILASPQKVSTMMGIFFISLGVGAFLSGKLATLAAITSRQNIYSLKAHYALAFTKLSGILLIAALLCIILYLSIRYLSKKNDDNTLCKKYHDF